MLHDYESYYKGKSIILKKKKCCSSSSSALKLLPKQNRRRPPRELFQRDQVAKNGDTDGARGKD